MTGPSWFDEKPDLVDLVKNLPTQTGDGGGKPNNRFDEKPPNPNRRWGKKTERFWKGSEQSEEAQGSIQEEDASDAWKTATSLAAEKM